MCSMSKRQKISDNTAYAKDKRACQSSNRQISTVECQVSSQASSPTQHGAVIIGLSCTYTTVAHVPTKQTMD